MHFSSISSKTLFIPLWCVWVFFFFWLNKNLSVIQRMFCANPQQLQWIDMNSLHVYPHTLSLAVAPLHLDQVFVLHKTWSLCWSHERILSTYRETQSLWHLLHTQEGEKCSMVTSVFEATIHLSAALALWLSWLYLLSRCYPDLVKV